MKLSAKDIAFLTFLHCGYGPLRDWMLARRGRARAVVLCYHRIGGRDVLSKPAAEFGRELAWLRKHYECIGLEELCQRLSSHQPLHRPVAVVTFDDGYRDNYTQAASALQAAGVPATFFVATGFMGTERPFPHDLQLDGWRGAAAAAPNHHPKLSWDDIRAMQDAGFEIGSHTVEHTDMGRADAPTTQRELRDSLAALDRELGARPRAFAFPWGKPANITRRALDEARRAGYYAVLSAFGGANTRGTDTFSIRRIDAGNGYLSHLAWRARVAGLDPDYMRWQLRARRLRARRL